MWVPVYTGVEGNEWEGQVVEESVDMDFTGS